MKNARLAAMDAIEGRYSYKIFAEAGINTNTEQRDRKPSRGYLENESRTRAESTSC